MFMCVSSSIYTAYIASQFMCVSSSIYMCFMYVFCVLQIDLFKYASGGNGQLISDCILIIVTYGFCFLKLSTLVSF